MRLAVLSVGVSVCLSVCLCTRIDGDIHSNERLLVSLYIYSAVYKDKYTGYAPSSHIFRPDVGL